MKKEEIYILIYLVLAVMFVWLAIFNSVENPFGCIVKNKILEAGGDLYQDASTDKQWKEYINKKYHFDPPVCSSYSEN